MLASDKGNFSVCGPIAEDSSIFDFFGTFSTDVIDVCLKETLLDILVFFGATALGES